MFTSNFGLAGSRKFTKDMAQGVCCQAGDNGFCQDTTQCAGAVHKSVCRGASPPRLNHALHASDAMSVHLVCAQVRMRCGSVAAPT